MLSFSKNNRYRIAVETWTIGIASLWKLTIAEVLTTRSKTYDDSKPYGKIFFPLRVRVVTDQLLLTNRTHLSTMRMKITMILILMTMAMWMLVIMLMTNRPFSQRGIQGCGNELSPNCCAWSWSWNEVSQTCKTFWKMITNLCQRKHLQKLYLSPARSQWSTGLSEHSQRRIFPSYLKNENKLQVISSLPSQNITAWNEIYVFIFHFQIISDMPEFQILENQLTSSPCLASPRGWTLNTSIWCNFLDKRGDNARLS